MKLPDNFLGISLVVTWLVVLMLDPISNKLDDMTSPQPWFEAELKLIENTEKEILVSYRKTVQRFLRAEPWYGWVDRKTVSGGWVKVCSGSGEDTYSPNQTGVSEMTLRFFTGSKLPCRTHGGEVRVCAAWHMVDRKERERTFGPTCSEPRKFDN